MSLLAASHNKSPLAGAARDLHKPNRYTSISVRLIPGLLLYSLARNRNGMNRAYSCPFPADQ
jgi:hypothetical protein